jgi:hypothetical protein
VDVGDTDARGVLKATGEKITHNKGCVLLPGCVWRDDDVTPEYGYSTGEVPTYGVRYQADI